jgi:hypothetical protein
MDERLAQLRAEEFYDIAHSATTSQEAIAAIALVLRSDSENIRMAGYTAGWIAGYKDKENEKQA